MKELIINTPSVLNLKQRTSSAFISFVFWLLWFYLWIPLSTFIGWYLGFDLVHYQIVELQHNTKFLSELYFFAKAVTLFGVSFGIWVAYNYYRFRFMERRGKSPHVTTQQLASYFNVNPVTLVEHQRAKYLSISFDDDGNIINHIAINLIDKKKFSESLEALDLANDTLRASNG